MRRTPPRRQASTNAARASQASRPAALALGVASAQAGQHNYHVTTHKLASQMNLGGHPEYRGLVEQLLNKILRSAHGYDSDMIAHALRGPGGDYWYDAATGTYGLE